MERHDAGNWYRSWTKGLVDLVFTSQGVVLVDRWLSGVSSKEILLFHAVWSLEHEVKCLMTSAAGSTSESENSLTGCFGGPVFVTHLHEPASGSS